MNRLLIPVLLIFVLLTGCGEGPVEQLSPLSPVPDNAMMVLVLNDPAGVVRNIDGYIETGAPILGAGMLEELVCGQLGIASLDSMPERYGFDPSGQLVFWMESAMPNSMTMAVSAPDLPLFISFIEEMGADLIPGEPILGNPVHSMDTGDGTVYISGTGGVALMAMSPARLEALMENLSGTAAFEVGPTCVAMRFNLSMIGPMAAAQMPMARNLMMQGLSEDPTMPAFFPDLMDVYMDGIQLVLTQSDRLSVTLTAGPEDLVVRKELTFLPGSELAEMSVSSGGRDMLELLPAGDVATVRFRMPGEMALGITSALTGVFLPDPPEGSMEFWSSLASNAAVSMYSDGPMHMAAAYELAGEETLADIASMYDDYMDVFQDFFSGNASMEGAFAITEGEIVQIDGVEFYTTSMEITQDPDTRMAFTYWMTVHQGALLLEMAPSPDILLNIVSGDFTPSSVAGEGDMAGEMSLAGYIAAVLAFSPGEMDLPEISSDVVMRWNGGFADGGIHGEFVMNGSDAFATGFALFGLLAATI